MRKIFSLLAALVLLTTLAVNASAKEGITLSNALGKAGQQVTMTVALEGSVKGDQILVEYSYDNKILEPATQDCEWIPKGSIDNFLKPKIKDTEAKGAWAASSAKELKGTLCTLAFRVKSGVSFDSTTVKCKVTVYNDDKLVGEYSADAKVLTSCSHSYSPWETRDDISHERSCTVCGDTQSNIHSWDEGKLKNGRMTFTCAVCSGVRSVAVEGSQEPITQPEQSKPEATAPQNVPPVASTPPNAQLPEETWPHQMTQPTQSTDSHDHSAQATDPFTGEPEVEITQPQTDPYTDYNAPEHTHPETTVPDHIELDHVHEHEEPANNKATPIVVAVAAVVLVGALVFFVKRKS